MAVLPQGATNMAASILSLFVTALTILFIVKIVLIFTSMGGFGGGKGGKDKGSEDKKSKDKKETSDENNMPIDKKAQDKQDKKVKKDKFDPYNTGQVKFLVCDEDDNPIQGAMITLEPTYAKKGKYWLVPSGMGKWAKNKDTWRKYGPYITNANGYAPSRDQYEEIGSGTLKLEVYKKHFIILPLDKDERHQIKHYTIEIKPSTQRLIIITMARKGEKDELFEPHIEDITLDNEQLNRTGVIR